MSRPAVRAEAMLLKTSPGLVLPTREHTRWQAAVFALKAAGLQTLRMVKDRGKPENRKISPLPGGENWPTAAASASPVWSAGNASEQRLQAGKVQNLRVALKSVAGIVIPTGATFSFWKQIGRPAARRGFAPGRELREGCIIPSTGGGLCQLSNALYECALKTGCEIVERHAHSRIIPGSMAEAGRDATVFWNYVDLRFRPVAPIRIEAHLTENELIVRFLTADPREGEAPRECIDDRKMATGSCASCGLTSCFRSLPLPGDGIPGFKHAILADEFLPEFSAIANPAGRFFVPLDGRRWGLERYAWDLTTFKKVKFFPVFAVCRTLKARHLRQSGAQRQRGLFALDRHLAALYARALRFDEIHLTVASNLLPHLWQDGVLGGRVFDVWMTRWPIAELQKRLDEAALLHPDSATLADFRAPQSIATAELEALAHARKIITPHPGIAALFPGRAEIIPWILPPMKNIAAKSGKRIVFPAPALARKGACELREAARQLNLEITVTGRSLEKSDFWQGVRTIPPEDDWLEDAAVVVLPSFIENQPRRLLEAVARGVPVIATPECGLGNLPGVKTIPAGDIAALMRQLLQIKSVFA